MKKRLLKSGRDVSAGGGKTTHWGEVAEWYDALVGEEGSEYQREVILPGVVRMLEGGEIENRKFKREKELENGGGLEILDLACGQGVLCRRLAALGHRVTGVDAAAELIAAACAREKAEPRGIRYEVADATRLMDESGFAAGLGAESFDAVTLILAIQNMTPLSPVWRACRGLLKPGGVLILVMMHPCFRIPRQSDWHWEGAAGGGGGTQARLVRQYLTSAPIAIQTHPGLAAHGRDASATTHFHRPLQAYINTLGNAGLLIDHIEEWTSHKKSQPGPRQAALDRARKEIPMFLALRGRKV
jgi:2-polyprenyl-3-methyl-5-hydroxy-6-metoxy-1,4-benzoquinol methylase